MGIRGHPAWPSWQEKTTEVLKVVITIINGKTDANLGKTHHSDTLVIVMSTSRGESSIGRTCNVTIRSWCENVVIVSQGGEITTIMVRATGDKGETLIIMTIKKWCENGVAVSQGGEITTIMTRATGDLGETLTIMIEEDKLDHNQKEIKDISTARSHKGTSILVTKIKMMITMEMTVSTTIMIKITLKSVKIIVNIEDKTEDSQKESL